MPDIIPSTHKIKEIAVRIKKHRLHYINSANFNIRDWTLSFGLLHKIPSILRQQIQQNAEEVRIGKDGVQKRKKSRGGQ